MYTSKSISLGLLLVAVAAISIGTIANNANADTKTLQCDTAKNCKVVFVRPRGNVEVTITNSGGGGGGGSTVDQTARDGVNELKGKDVTQDSKIDAVQAENQGLKQNVTDLSTQLNNANTEISSLQSDINTMKLQIANISNTNPVVDVNVTNSNGTGPVITPPPVNNTGTGGDNSTVPVEPPVVIDNGTATNTTTVTNTTSNTENGTTTSNSTSETIPTTYDLNTLAKQLGF